MDGLHESRLATLRQWFALVPPGSDEVLWFHRSTLALPHLPGPACWCCPVTIHRDDFPAPDAALAFIEAGDRLN